MAIAYGCLFFASMILTCAVSYRWTKVLSLIEQKHPALHRRIAYPAPVRGGPWSVFRLSGLLDDTVLPVDRQFIRRTQNLVVLSTMVGLAMLIVWVLGAVR